MYSASALNLPRYKYTTTRLLQVLKCLYLSAQHKYNGKQVPVVSILDPTLLLQ